MTQTLCQQCDYRNTEFQLYVDLRFLHGSKPSNKLEEVLLVEVSGCSQSHFNQGSDEKEEMMDGNLPLGTFAVGDKYVNESIQTGLRVSDW